MSDAQRKEGEGDDAFVTIRMSRELVAILSSGWSQPVRLLLAPSVSGNPNEHELIATRHECEKRS